MGLLSCCFFTLLSPKTWESWSWCEVYVKATWRFLDRDQHKFCRALLLHRNTPSRKDILFSAQRLFGHPVQSAHHRAFLSEWQHPLAMAEQQYQDNLESSCTYIAWHHRWITCCHPKSKGWDIYMVSSLRPTYNVINTLRQKR